MRTEHVEAGWIWRDSFHYVLEIVKFSYSFEGNYTIQQILEVLLSWKKIIFWAYFKLYSVCYFIGFPAIYICIEYSTEN